MPGKLGANFRRGHLAEDLGVFFLRSFCAVADLRQEDDFGLDAIATLLSRKDGVLYAEESFAVQIKAASVTSMSYGGLELEWLLDQRLPLFFLTVDLNEGAFSVYTANPVYALFPYTDVHSAKLFLTSPDARHSRLKLADDQASIHIGPPILATTIGRLNDREHLQSIYDLMKVWVTSELNQAGFRVLKKSRLMQWEIWQQPEPSGTVTRGGILNLKRDMRVVEPYISYLAEHLIWSLDDPELENAFLTLKNWFEECGVETSLDEEEIRGQMRSQPLTRADYLALVQELTGFASYSHLDN